MASKSDVPSATDPVETASAQTSANVGTAIANAYLNNTNQVTSSGTLNYDKTGEYSWYDPYTGQTYNVPTFTATQTLSDIGQDTEDQLNQAKLNLAGMANSQSQAISNLLSNPLDTTKGNFNAQSYLDANPDVRNAAKAQGVNENTFALQHWNEFGRSEGRTGGYGEVIPDAGSAENIANSPDAVWWLSDTGKQKRTFADTGQQQTTFADAGDITRDYGPVDNFSADRARTEEALYGRLNPQLDRERGNLEQRLADQGIRYGSAAYNDAMDDYNRQANDMRLAVVKAGGEEQTRLMNLEAQRAGFQNAAQKQAYEQALGRGTFANTAQQQAYTQALGRGTFENAAQQQDYAQELSRSTFYNSAQAQNLAKQQSVFNAQNAARNQWLNEQYAQRNQPINEISALLSGSQVSNPNFVDTPNSQISTTDVASIINNNYNQQLSTYQATSNNFNSLMGGILGLGGSLAKLSDVREKDDIERIGTVFAASDDGGKPSKLPIYEYSYKRDPTDARHTGPMAQDVERIDKRAVITRGGRKYIDQTKLGSILKVA